MAEVRLDAGGVIVSQRSVVLLRKRTNDEFRLPKGKVERGETPEQAALREVAEEAGFDDLAVVADLGEELVEYRTANGWVARRQRFFLMRPTTLHRIARNPRDARRFEVRWMTFDAALEAITFVAERQALQRAIERCD